MVGGDDRITREVSRYMVGANGDFGMLGKDWSWDVYYQ